LGRGPYQPTVKKFVKGILSGDLKKNENYSLHEASAKLGLHENTLRDNMQSANLSEINKALQGVRPGYKIKWITIPREGLRVEGCVLGPLGVVRHPIEPRWQAWLETSPKPLIWLMEKPKIREGIQRPVIPYGPAREWLADRTTLIKNRPKVF
jgi:hypothetical protein